MSVSRLPRLYFNGHFSWNPSTNNNDDYSEPSSTTPPLNPPVIPFNPASGIPNWPWLREQSFEGQPVTPANYRQWSWSEAYDLGKDAQGHDRRLPPSEWNFFGGMECGFVTDSFPVLEQPPNPDNPGTPVFSKPTGTRVCSYTSRDGRFLEEPSGLELQFNCGPPKGPFGASPKLIDVNPQSPFTSQIFADDFQLGDGSNGFSAPLTQPMQSRWLYFNRNYNLDDGLMIAGVASTVFQTTMRNGEIEWTDASAPVNELREAAEEAAGVTFRMVAYDTMYFNGEFFGPLGNNQFPGMMKMRDLYVQYFNELEKYKAGVLADAPVPPCNRAYSRTVGWLGVWDHDDYVTFPTGRLLTPYVLPHQPFEPQPKDAPVALKLNAFAKPVPLGPLMVARDSDFNRITVDLGSTLPELDSGGDFAPLGPIDLGISIDGSYHKLRTLIPDPARYTQFYNLSAGILDVAVADLEPINGVPLTAEEFDHNPLVLKANSDEGSSPSEPQPTVALFEAALNAQTNTRGLYVDEPDPAVSGPTTTFCIEIKERDAAPASQVGLVLMQVDANFKTLTGNGRRLEVSYQAPSGQWIEVDSNALLDVSSGSVTVGLRGRTGPGSTVAGALPLIFFLPVATQDLPAGLSPESPVPEFASGLVAELSKQGWPENPNLIMSMGYAAVRLWPYHSTQLAAFENYLAGTPSVDEVNNWVFANVYETFHLMYPVMDFIGTPQRFQAWRGRILEVTKPENFLTSSYMPPTRTLSGAQRTILERYDEYLAKVNEVGRLRTASQEPSMPTKG